MEEIIAANGTAILMMWFLLICRRKNRENLHTEDKIYDGMVVVNLLGALFETVTFLVDGRIFPGGRAINHIFNSLCFIGTVSIGLLWVLYVDLRIYRNYKRTAKKIGIVMIPWLVEVVIVVCNLFGTGILFKITESNVYQRSSGAVIGYVSLVIYFIYSVFLVCHSKKEGINLSFFPVEYFVGPCVAGVFIQFFFYGITSSWVSVAIALTFVQMQSYAENLYTDELSGLYNRRYFNAVLAEKEKLDRRSLHGIMMDLNDFKSINDNLGHNVGDHAICTMGNILFRSIPDSGMAIRYAGDEFIVLLLGVDKEATASTMKEINNKLSEFNDSGAEPFRLSVAMGCAEFEEEDDAESFLTRMDERMYAEKRKYHLNHGKADRFVENTQSNTKRHR